MGQNPLEIKDTIIFNKGVLNMDFALFIDYVSLFSQFCGWIITIITLFTLIVPKARSWCSNKIKKIIGYQVLYEKIEEITKTTESLNSSIKELKKDFKEHLDSEKVRDEALLGILRDTLKREFQRYIEKGSITFEELMELENLIKPYFAMGGNGTVKSAWENTILKLPRK